jgi:hypothetical protein
MSNAVWGHAFPLYDSLPCYSLQPGQSEERQTAQDAEYQEKAPTPFYNLRTHIPFDVNWGRSQEYIPGPLSWVDKWQKKPHYEECEQWGTDYRFLPHRDPTKIVPTSNRQPTFSQN